MSCRSQGEFRFPQTPALTVYARRPAGFDSGTTCRCPAETLDGCDNRQVPQRPFPDPDRPYFTPSKRVAGDWSAHIATTLDRTATLLAGLTPEQWETPSKCDGWSVRDVAGHLAWRLGSPTSSLVRESSKGVFRKGLRVDAYLDDIAKREGAAPTEELVARIRSIAATKVVSPTRAGISELTEAVVHTYDMTEALGLRIRLSPRSTSAVALVRTRVPLSSAASLAKRNRLRATDARWQIGDKGPVVEGTAAQLVLKLFGRSVQLDD